MLCTLLFARHAIMSKASHTLHLLRAPAFAAGVSDAVSFGTPAQRLMMLHHLLDGFAIDLKTMDVNSPLADEIRVRRETDG